MNCRSTNGVRRMAAVLCIFCTLFLSCPAALTVNAKSDAKLTVSDVTAERGSMASVTVSLEGNPGIWGLKLKVGYDHSALTLQSVTNGTVFEDGDIVLPAELSREKFVYVAASGKLEDVTADGAMVTLNFLVADGAKEQDYPVALEVSQAVNAAGEDVKAAASGGNVTVKGGGTGTDRPDIPPSAEPEELGEEGGEGSALTASGVKTGDDSSRAITFSLMTVMLSGIGICGVLYIRRGRKSR